MQEELPPNDAEAAVPDSPEEAKEVSYSKEEQEELESESDGPPPLAQPEKRPGDEFRVWSRARAMLAAALIALRVVVRFGESVGVSRIVAGEDVGFLIKRENEQGSSSSSSSSRFSPAPLASQCNYDKR